MSDVMLVNASDIAFKKTFSLVYLFLVNSLGPFAYQSCHFLFKLALNKELIKTSKDRK
jgi:hypothetical protein